MKRAWPDDIRIFAKWMCVIGALLYVRWGAITFFHVPLGPTDEKGIITGGDFVNMWAAAKIALRGDVMTLFDLTAYHKNLEDFFAHTIPQFYNWSYPPHFLLLILPLGFLSYPAALAVWITFTFALFAFAVAYNRPSPWWLVGVLALSPAACANFSVGQNGFLSAALLVGGLRLLPKHPWLAGIAFGLLTYKPHLGILVPIVLIAMREWRTIFAAATTCIALVTASITAFGIAPWQAYITQTMPFQRGLLEIAPRTLYTRMNPSVFMSARIVGASVPVAYALALATSITVIILTVRFVRRYGWNDLTQSMVLMATFLISPYLFFYDMPIVFSAIIGTVATAGARLKAPEFMLLALAAFLPILVYPLGKAGIPVAPVIFILFFTQQIRQFYILRRTTKSGIVED